MDKKDKLSAIVFGIPAMLFLCIGLVGCMGEKHIVPPPETTMYYTEKGGWIYNVMIIDHCQYIQRDHGFSHKGDCTNSIHIYNKPLAEATK